MLASAAEPTAADGSVTVLLFVDQRLRAVDGKVGQLVQQRMQLVMVKSHGTWLADKVSVTGGQ